MVATLTSKTVSWEANRVGSAALRSLLQAMSAMEPERSQLILSAAGLDRVRFAVPPSSTEGGITHGDLARLYGAIHARLGETLTRSFLTTHGRLVADQLKADSNIQGLRTEAKALTSVPDRLAWSVRTAAQLLSEPGNALEVEESADEFRVSRAHCSICARVATVRAPLCASVEEVLTALIRDLSGVRATAIEFECHAAGAERCRYRVRR